jgi:hypothetical protein
MIPAVLFFIYSEKPENMTSGTPKQIAVTYSKCYFDETCNPRLKGGNFSVHSITYNMQETVLGSGDIMVRNRHGLHSYTL